MLVLLLLSSVQLPADTPNYVNYVCSDGSKRSNILKKISTGRLPVTQSKSAEDPKSFDELATMFPFDKKPGNFRHSLPG